MKDMRTMTTLITFWVDFFLALAHRLHREVSSTNFYTWWLIHFLRGLLAPRSHHSGKFWRDSNTVTAMPKITTDYFYGTPTQKIDSACFPTRHMTGSGPKRSFPSSVRKSSTGQNAYNVGKIKFYSGRNSSLTDRGRIRSEVTSLIDFATLVFY
jgi:hypothetical protein